MGLALDKYKDTLDKKVEDDAEVKKLTDDSKDEDRAKAITAAKSKTENRENARKAAKEYFTTELKGDESDFDEEEFKKMAELADKKVTYTKDKKVEMQVRTDIGSSDLDTKKKDMEDSIKEAVVKVSTNKNEKVSTSVKVSCGKSNGRGTKTNIVCKIDAKDATEAKKIEEYTRDSNFKTELKTKFNNKGRRLKNGRHLSANSMEVESSQALTAEGVDVGSNNPGTGTLGSGSKLGSGKSRSPTPAADDDEDILSVSSRRSMSTILTSVVGIVFAYLLF